MALISGARSTENINQDRRKFDVSDKLWLVDPDYAVMTFFARKLAKQKTIDPEFRWFDKAQPSRYDAVDYATNYTSGATDVIVDDGTKFRAGDIVMDVSTGEHMRVTSIATNTLTVVRGYGTTAAGTLTNNDVLVIIGNAFAENADVGTARSSQVTKRYNYTQIFREPFAVTGTEDSTELYAGGNDLAQLRKEHLQIHMKDIERAFLFGEAKEDVSTIGSGQPIRTTGGLKSFLTTNLKDASGTLTEAEFEDWVRMLFQNGGDKKMAFVSPLIASAINSWAKGRLQMFPKDKTYGIAVSSYLSIHGQLDFVVEKMFAENTTWAGMAFGVDMSLISYRYLAGNGKSRDTRLLKDRQGNGVDGIIEEYLTEAGLQVALENRHGLLYGVTGYSA
jgi:hypothetical protein